MRMDENGVGEEAEMSATEMSPREYNSVAQSDIDQHQPTSISRRRWRLLDARSARTWIVATWLVFAVVVIIGGVIVTQSAQSNGAQSQATSGMGISTSPSPPPKQVSDPEEDNFDEGGAEKDPTHRPSSSKSGVQKISEPTTSETCDELYDCISDRLGQNSPLKSGQAICSRDDRYMFGMDDGSLLWKDCTTGETKKYYKKGGSGDYFMMDEAAKFRVYGEDGQVKWERACKATVKKFEKCLSKPAYDCPYLHLHKGGVVVLNYIDGWDWISKNIKKMYDV